jgi:hypothetical protein
LDTRTAWIFFATPGIIPDVVMGTFGSIINYKRKKVYTMKKGGAPGYLDDLTNTILAL